MSYKAGDRFVNSEAAFTAVDFRIKEVIVEKKKTSKAVVKTKVYKMENMLIEKAEHHIFSYEKLRFFNVEESKLNEMIERKFIKPLK